VTTKLRDPIGREFTDLMDRFRGELEADLETWIAERRRQTMERAPEAVILLDRLEALLQAGGKRLRPALVSFGFLACGGDSPRRVQPAALATELLHAYLLVHDDIMDHADTRRGEPAAHAFFRDRYRSLYGKKGQGESARQDSQDSREAQDYGISMGILVGDLAQTCAMELFAACQVDPALDERLRDTFYGMCREVVDGQFLEMQMGLGGDPSEDDLARVLRLKSGLYSVERPIQLGAILADADEATFDALSRYGRAVGEAFQLKDDLLGVFGDPEATGKPVGGDLLEGKFTFIIHRGLAQATPEEARHLRSVLANPSASLEAVERAVHILRERGAEQAVREMIEERSQEAREILATLDLTPSEETRAGKAFLLGLVSFLEERQH